MTAILPAQRSTPDPATDRLTQPRKLRLTPLPAGWPLWALIALYPVWWLLGLGEFAYVLFAVPMLVDLLRRRPIKLPPGFGLWLLFLLLVVMGFAFLRVNPSGTLVNAFSSRIIATSVRLVEYLAVTVALLYVGNLPERDMPQRRIVGLLSLFFCYTVAGGMLGTLLPHFQVTSPLALVVPHSLQSNVTISSLTHPAAAQIQTVLGYAAPRPSAPFPFTNEWGNNLSILAVWFVVGWCLRRGLVRKLTALAIMAIAVVPIVFSLNRGMWIGLGLSLVYVAVRLAARGKLFATGLLALLGVTALVVFTLTPLQTIVSGRLQHGQSNDIRAFTTTQTLQVSQQSPIVGFGSTRPALGSTQSIAVGRTSNCPRCGNPEVGANGQSWLTIISQGYVGLFFYVGFFVYSLWRYRRDNTAIGMAGMLVIMLSLLYMFAYNALVSPLFIYLVSIALLWRNDALRLAPVKPNRRLTRPRRSGGVIEA